MVNLVIKNIPQPLHFKLKERAKRNHRSVTKETIALIERAVELPSSDALNANDPLAAIFAAGDLMAQKGVNFQEWAASSRDVWR